jgi:hypothetical protein
LRGLQRAPDRYPSLASAYISPVAAYGRTTGYGSVCPPTRPGVTAAGVMYDAGLSRAVIIARLPDPVMMKVMHDPRAYTE